MNKRTLILIAIGLLVVVPIVLNFFVRINSCIPTIGDERDWLAFFGSYWGGVFSCIVAFIAVYRQFKQGVQDMQIRDQEQKIEHLSQDLSNCIGSFNFAQIGAISPYTNEPYEHIDAEIARLNEEHVKVTKQANVWGLLYEHSEIKEIQAFNTSYFKCVTDFQNEVNDMTASLFQLRQDKNYPAFCAALKNRNNKLSEYQQTTQKTLFQLAQSIIDQERNTLKQLQAKRKKF